MRDWHVNTVVERMQPDREETWEFVMAEADRAEAAARARMEAELRDRQEEIERERRRKMDEEDLLHRNMYETERRRRAEEVAEMLREQGMVTTDRRVSPTPLRDSKMRLAAEREARANEWVPDSLRLAKERAALGFRSTDELMARLKRVDAGRVSPPRPPAVEALRANPQVKSAHIWPLDLLVRNKRRPAETPKQPGIDPGDDNPNPPPPSRVEFAKTPVASSIPPSPSSSAPPPSVAGTEGAATAASGVLSVKLGSDGTLPPRDPELYSKGSGLSYAPSVATTGHETTDTASTLQQVPPDYFYAPVAPIDYGVAGEVPPTSTLASDVMRARFTGPLPPSNYNPPPTKPSYMLPAVTLDGSEWDKDLQTRLGERLKHPPSTDQLLRQHYNRVLTARGPTREEVDASKALYGHQKAVWARRHTHSALQRLLSGRQQSPHSLPPESALKRLADDSSPLTALENARVSGALSKVPPVLYVTAPAKLGLSGAYALNEDGSVFALWSSGERHVVCSAGRWVIGHRDERPEDGGGPIRSVARGGDYPHEIPEWEWQSDPGAEWEVNPAITVTVEPPADHGASGASHPDDPTAASDAKSRRDEEESAKSKGDGEHEEIPPAEGAEDGTKAAEGESTDPVAAALADGVWVEKKDPKSGKTYYYNKDTKETTWDLAKHLAKGPDQPPSTSRKSDDQLPEDPLTAAVQHALATGEWKEKVDPKSGKPYYVNTATKETCWDLRKLFQKRGMKAAPPQPGEAQI